MGANCLWIGFGKLVVVICSSHLTPPDFALIPLLNLIKSDIVYRIKITGKIQCFRAANPLNLLNPSSKLAILTLMLNKYSDVLSQLAPYFVKISLNTLKNAHKS